MSSFFNELLWRIAIKNSNMAQQIQSQKVQSKSLRSKPKTTSVPSSSVSASVGKNQSKPLSFNQTEKLLDLKY